jgi:hypothetical protein
MFRYKGTNFKERNVPGLKPTASDKPLFTQLYSLQYNPVLLFQTYS